METKGGGQIMFHKVYCTKIKMLISVVSPNRFILHVRKQHNGNFMYSEILIRTEGLHALNSKGRPHL